MFSKRRIFAAAFLAASAAASAPASADPILYLHNMQLSDGGKANGSFTYYTPLDIPYNFNITTTAGTVMPGATYTTAVNPNTNHYLSGLPAGVGEIIQFQLHNYQGYLQLAFEDAITSATDHLVYGYSFECSGFAGVTPGGCNGTERDFVAPGSGKSSISTTPVPEPSSLSLVAAGLMAAGGLLLLARRRKPAAAAV